MKTIKDAYIDLFRDYPHMQRDKEVIRMHYKEYLPAINEAVEKRYILEDQVIYWWVIDDSILYNKEKEENIQLTIDL